MPTGSPPPGGPTWPSVLTRLLAKGELSTAEAAWAMREILTGEATDAQIAAFVVALRAKGETAGELTGLADAMLAAAAPLPAPAGRGALVDTCGTGGDRRHTVNISTMAALVVAGAGRRVAKHGNRAASSACGSADLLEALGVAIDLPPAGVARCLERAGVAFCFAPVFHPAMRHAAVPRRELGVPTVFNVLGPLTNPARPSAQVVGVAEERLAPVVAGVLAARGTHALVVHGEDGMDELSAARPSRVWVAGPDGVREGGVDPERLGLRGGDVTGGDAAHNAAVCRAFLAGAPGPVRDAVLLNAAAGLVVADAAERGGSAGRDRVVDLLAQALVATAAAVDSGAAAGALERWVSASVETAGGGSGEASAPVPFDPRR